MYSAYRVLREQTGPAPVIPQELLRMLQGDEVVEVRYERTEWRNYIRQEPFGTYDSWCGRFDIWSFLVPYYLIQSSR